MDKTRGWRKREIGKENRIRVFDWFGENPDASNIEASRALGLSQQAVGRHRAMIDAGWHPDDESQVK